jgi:hypothetical protein
MRGDQYYMHSSSGSSPTKEKDTGTRWGLAISTLLLLHVSSHFLLLHLDRRQSETDPPKFHFLLSLRAVVVVLLEEATSNWSRPIVLGSF